MPVIYLHRLLHRFVDLLTQDKVPSGAKLKVQFSEEKVTGDGRQCIRDKEEATKVSTREVESNLPPQFGREVWTDVGAAIPLYKLVRLAFTSRRGSAHLSRRVRPVAHLWQ